MPTPKDAEQNRVRIVEAAHQVFAEHGVHAPVREIARAAGVGVATLYRHFPDRTDLVEAVFIDRGLEYLQALHDALAADDSWQAFVEYLERLFSIQRRSRGVTDLLTVALPRSPRLEEIRSRIYDKQLELIDRAKKQGLRADFVPEDVILLLIANAAIVEAVGENDPRSSPRFCAMALQALAADTVDPKHPLPPPTPSSDLAGALQRPAVIERARRVPVELTRHETHWSLLESAVRRRHPAGDDPRETSDSQRKNSQQSLSSEPPPHLSASPAPRWLRLARDCNYNGVTTSGKLGRWPGR